MKRALALGIALVLALLPTTASAQDGFERLEVRITAVSGGSVYLDAGRDALLQPGDAVRLFPTGGAPLDGTVRAVSRTSARVALHAPLDGLQIGDLGEVLIPAERRAPEPTDAERDAPVEPLPATPIPGTPLHQTPVGNAPAPQLAAPAQDAPKWQAPEPPIWEQPPPEWDAETPLLAPVSRREPEDREVRLRGRIYGAFDTVRDGEPGDRSYLSARTGLDVTWENPLRSGGELTLDGELFHRTAEDEDSDETEDHLRVDRFSYAWGGVRDRPRRWEVGRFLHHEFPELGVVDGVEYGYRTKSGNRVGASIGLFPEWNDELKNGDDVQASVFYRWLSDESERLALGAAYQKTWHDGEADRDLLLGTAEYHLSQRTWLYATAWVDSYGSDDAGKSSGLELTQLNLNATHRFVSGNGVGAFLTHYRTPSTLKDDGSPPTPEDVAETKVTRYGLRGWWNANPDTRLDGRLSAFTDQDGSGGSAELDVTVRDLLWERGSVRFGVYGNEGSFSSGVGVRVSADRRLQSGFLRLSLDVSEIEQSSAFGGDESLLHNLLRATWDTSLGRNWDLSLYADQRFGDAQDSQSVGFLIQRRF